MKYLSIDLEATGLDENDYIIEFGMIPFDAENRTLEENLARRYLVSCPSYESLLPNLDPWVIEHNESLIKDAHSQGLERHAFKKELETYLNTTEVKNYFGNEKIMIFGKSLNAIDLPFLTRDLGWEFMRRHFNHRVLDLSSTANTLVDMNFLPEKCTNGSELMNHLGMGEVCHTAMDDARNTAIMYLKLLDQFAK